MTATPARTLVLLRILTLYPVVLAWSSTRPDRLAVALACALVLSTSVLALGWAAVVPVVRRHPGLAAIDVAISLLVLAQAGTDSPFVAYTMTSAVLIGLFFTRLGATLLVGLLVSGYVLLAHADLVGGLEPAASLVSVPVAYVVLVCAGAAFRGMHDRLALAAATATSAERVAATARERTRLARDLHDGVSSTLQGVVLQSMALSRVAQRSERRVAELAGELEMAARSALAQSREVLTGLRREDDSAPLVQAVSDRAHAWGRRTGIRITFDATGVADVEAAARIAALRVLDEALENVHRHAAASRVRVTLEGDERSVCLQVEDDGRGMAPDRPGVREGHYGLLGMTERAGVAGASLSFAPARLGDPLRPGTCVRLELARPATAQPVDLRQLDDQTRDDKTRDDKTRGAHV